MASRGAYGKGYSRGFSDGKVSGGKGSVVATVICGAITAIIGFWFGKKK
jgi:outer membrane lipoprotein SlyB